MDFAVQAFMLSDVLSDQVGLPICVESPRDSGILWASEVKFTNSNAPLGEVLDQICERLGDFDWTISSYDAKCNASIYPLTAGSTHLTDSVNLSDTNLVTLAELPSLANVSDHLIWARDHYQGFGITPLPTSARVDPQTGQILVPASINSQIVSSEVDLATLGTTTLRNALLSGLLRMDEPNIVYECRWREDVQALHIRRLRPGAPTHVLRTLHTQIQPNP